MNTDEIRVACLKITYAHSREATEAVDRAKTLEAYVVGKGRRKKKPAVRKIPTS